MADQKLTALTLINIAQITDLIYVVTYDADGETTSVAMSIGDLQQSVITGVNRIVAGQVVWTGVGFTHRSINLSYEINGIIYFSNDEPITNAAPDGSNPRFDVIFVDADGLDIKEGTPAGSPTVPSLDNPTSELATNIVLVTNGETTPTDVVLDALYSENLQESGGEWDTAASTGVRIDLANTDDPINLTKDIKINTALGDDYFTLINSTPIAIADFQNIRHTFRLLGNWKQDKLRVFFYDGATLAGYSIITRTSFASNELGIDQDVYVHKGMISWTVGETQFDEIRYIFLDAGGSSPVSSVKFQLDLIKMEHGSTITVPITDLSMDVMLNMTSAKTTPIDADNLTLWDSVVQQFKQLPIDDFGTYLTTLYVALTGNQSVAGIKTFSSFPVTPSSAPTTDYQVANKKYVDDNAPIMYNVKSYGALGDGVDYADGALTATDATFTSASNPFVSGDVGKVISIDGAGTAGAYHVTTIASYTSAGEVELTDVGVTTVSGAAVFRFGTDDTSALQTLIQTVYDAIGGVIYFPNGIYILNGALQNNIGPDLIDYNSVIWIPDSDSDVLTRPVIEFLGEVHPNILQSGGLTGFEEPPTSGVILYSTIQGSGTRPSVIASRGAAGNPFGLNYTNSQYKNLAIQVTPDANSKVTMGYINCKFSATANFDYCTGYPYNLDLFDSGEPDVIDVVGIALPRDASQDTNTVRNCAVGGVTHGYLSGDHASLHDAVAICCVNGFTQDTNFALSTYVKISSLWCINDFNVIAQSYFNVLSFQNEWASQGKWFDNVNTILDASDNGVGTFNWLVVEKDVGYAPDRYVKDGGDKIMTKPIGVDDLTNTQTGTSYTFTILDAYRLTEGTNAGATNFTVPPDSTLNFDLGAIILVKWTGVGQITIVAGGGVTINTPETLLLRIQHSMVAIVKTATNTWTITGDLKLV